MSAGAAENRQPVWGSHLSLWSRSEVRELILDPFPQDPKAHYLGQPGLGLRPRTPLSDESARDASSAAFARSDLFPA